MPRSTGAKVGTTRFPPAGIARVAAVRRRLLDLFFLCGDVDAVSAGVGRMRHVRVSGAALERLSWKPGQQVRIDVAERGFVPVLRTYSIWDYRDSTLDFTLRPGRYHLFAGEETASVAFGPMLRGLPDGERVSATVLRPPTRPLWSPRYGNSTSPASRVSPTWPARPVRSRPSGSTSSTAAAGRAGRCSPSPSGHPARRVWSSGGRSARKVKT